MKKLISLFLFLLFLCGYTALAQHTTGLHTAQASHVMVNHDKLQWTDGPPALPAGANLAVLDGDPTKEGMFTIRVMFPANFKIAPHWHPTAEHVTVLEGAFYMGTSEKMDMTNATALQVGGFAYMPAKMVHFGFTKEQTVLQIHGNGPFSITYVNAADDPRNKSKIPK